jgi:trk system potassium uptake protein TrkA
VIGAGEAGSHLAKYLTKEAHDVTLVDHDVRALQRAARVADIQTIEGHGASYSILERAGAGQADLFVAVTSHDELNMVACMLARKLGAKRTVVRVHATRDTSDNPFIYKDILGFDFMISPGEMAAIEILRICRGQNAMPVEHFAGGRLQMRRLELSEGSPGVGKSLMSMRLPRDVLATAVLRGAEVSIPRGDFVLGGSDYVMLIGIPEALDKAEKILGGRRDLPKRVLIHGGGSIAMLVSKDLASLGVSVRIFESDRDAADRLASRLSNVHIVHGEGTDMELLNQEGVGRADFFIALTDRDETNLLSCQLARNLGAGKTMALINRGDFVALVDRLGIDHAVSPRRLVARRIAQLARGSAAGSLTQLHHGAAEVLDLPVSERWTYIGHVLKDIPFPTGSVVGGVVRGDEIFVPRGETAMQAGDHLLIFALKGELQDVLSLMQREADSE